MEKDLLIRTVSSLFEKTGTQFFTLEEWFRMMHVFSTLEIPNDPPSHNYIAFPQDVSKTCMNAPFIELLTEYREAWIEPIAEISFVSLYPHIILALTQQQLIPFDKDVLILKLLVENFPAMKKYMSDSGVTCTKAWMNYYYGIKGISTPDFKETVSASGNWLMQSVKDMMTDRYVCADTDTIFYRNWLETDRQDRFRNRLDLLGFPYTASNYAGGMFFGKKKRMTLTSDGMLLKGITHIK